MRAKVSLLLVLCICCFFICSCTSKNETSSPELSGADLSASESIYCDGVYEGKGTGYGRGLKVSVTITDGKITDIQIISHNEVGKQYYEKAFEVIPTKIIDAQSADVDAVSGATKSSNGLMQAVEDALEKAKVADE